MQKDISVIDSELALLETRFTHHERFVKEQTFKSDLHIIPKSKDLGIVALAEIVEGITSKNSPTWIKQIGIDGGKLMKGQKRFYITDTLSNLFDCFVVPANSYDGTTARLAKKI